MLRGDALYSKRDIADTVSGPGYLIEALPAMRNHEGRVRVHVQPRHDVVGSELPFVVWIIDEHCSEYSWGVEMA